MAPSIKKRIAKALQACGLAVNPAAPPLRFHSHCAGMDSPAFALDAIGIKTVGILATEANPHAALFHLIRHTSTEHVVVDMEYPARGSVCAPCFKHGGKICTWNDNPPDFLFSSFVCKPYSRANAKRHKADPCVQPGESKSVDTFYHTVNAIKHSTPRVFLLENVDGISMPRTSDGSDTPLDFMLDDTTHGLRSVRGSDGRPLYTVECVSGVSGMDVGMCQARPRTLFFGVRVDNPVDASTVVSHFRAILRAYGAAGPPAHIDDYLEKHEVSRAADLAHQSLEVACDQESLQEHITYCEEFQKAVEHLQRKHPALPGRLIAEESRPSMHVQGSARVKATIDAVSLVLQSHHDGCVDAAVCRCHPLADVSQRPDRLPMRQDGTIPTLCTSSLIFSYKSKQFIRPQDLAASMGYKSTNMSFLSPTAGHTLVGNGYLVPICACAIAAAGSVTGHIIKHGAPAASTASSKTATTPGAAAQRTAPNHASPP